MVEKLVAGSSTAITSLQFSARNQGTNAAWLALGFCTRLAAQPWQSQHRQRQTGACACQVAQQSRMVVVSWFPSGGKRRTNQYLDEPFVYGTSGVQTTLAKELQECLTKVDASKLSQANQTVLQAPKLQGLRFDGLRVTAFAAS